MRTKSLNCLAALVLVLAISGTAAWFHLRQAVTCREAAIGWATACDRAGRIEDNWFDWRAFAARLGTQEQEAKSRLASVCELIQMGKPATEEAHKFSAEEHSCRGHAAVCIYEEAKSRDAMAFECHDDKIAFISLFSTPNLSIDDCRRCAWGHAQ